MNTINKWDIIVSILDFTLQPIVDINTGKIYGVEALLRNHQFAGFDTIGNVFDMAYLEGYLYSLDLRLREKAIKKFNKLKFANDIKLFYNLDNRVIEMPNFTMGNTGHFLEKEGLQKNNLVFEISEKHKFNSLIEVNKILELYKNQGYNMAIDDFGSGFSNLQELYHIDVSILKIDRFFIDGISKCQKKILFVKNIVNLVHSLGGLVVAEGVETIEEALTCQRIKCDLIQGYYIAYPTQDYKEIKTTYENFKDMQKDNYKSKKAIENYLQYIKPLNIEEPFENLLEKFIDDENLEFIPIVDNQERPLGIVDFKKFGRYFLKNNAFSGTVSEFLEKTFILDINFTLNKLIEYLNLDSLNIILMTSKGKYIGYLDKSSIIKIVTEKSVIEARSQNPLTKLHGNLMVYDFIKNSLENPHESFAFIYFDFNNFKKFNDKYGFKKGDELIILFGELLKNNFSNSKDFIGHIGGDDFFLGLSYRNHFDFNYIYITIQEFLESFSKKAKTYYDKTETFVLAQNDKYVGGQIPYITVASVILEVPFERKEYSIDEISRVLFRLKKEAKGKGNYINAASLIRDDTLLKLGGYL